MTPMRRNHGRAALLATAIGLSFAACKIEPRTPTLRYELNPNALALNEDLLDDGVAQDQIRGALEMLFGTPSHPGFLRTQDWIDDEWNPNWGDGELSDGEWDALVADNTTRFAHDLTAIADGRLDDVRLQREALDLRARWADEVMAEWDEFHAVLAGEERFENDDDAEPMTPEEAQAGLDALVLAVQEEWPETLANWYPSLRDSAELYRQQCLHCHGVAGGGDGPTAPYLEPRPRDYRQGQFKFTALNNKARPRRADLYRILAEGVYTTAMPSFRRFSDAQLQGLVDYVRLLSIRGETEILLALEYDIDDGLPLDAILETYDFVWERWNAAEDEVIVYDGDVPRSTPERIAHGRELFMDPNSANCFSCHGPDARGGGPSAFEKDENGEDVPVKDDWGNDVIVRDLTRGLFRFGRRPIDLYRRVYAGINGTPMPSHSSLTKPDGSRMLSDEDLWDIVHFVRSLSTHAPQPAAAPTEDH